MNVCCTVLRHKNDLSTDKRDAWLKWKKREARSTTT